MTILHKKVGGVLSSGTPCLPVSNRICNFDEVAIGYTDEQAKIEASRCLQCKRPRCKQACPAQVRIPEFIAALLSGDLKEAYRIIRTTNSLPAICGRVCPQDTQCEGSCVLKAKGNPVCIGRLERYVADSILNMEVGLYVGLNEYDAKPPVVTHCKVACIGSGPASLTAAGYLIAQGIGVTIFDPCYEHGGILTYGIPTFRLPNTVVSDEIKALRSMGVTFSTQGIGDTLTIQHLFDEGYKAIFIGIGAGLSCQLGIPGEDISGVFLATKYLKDIKVNQSDKERLLSVQNNYLGRSVTVFGAGNVAMDASRTAIRLGAEKVHIIYRRTKSEMPARDEEIAYAEEEGVNIMELVAPVAFHKDKNNKLCSVTLQRMTLGEPDASGRRCAIPIKGELFEYTTDLAIIAIGSKPNQRLLEKIQGLKLTHEGYILTDEVGETSIPNVFAGGDIVTGAQTVVLAMDAGRKAAQAISKRLLEK
ncbi:NAD(P)-dependent oxidoreductase [Lawsonia intracellularis]|uniref:NADPH-dependent glutamate synthase beta chain and related oxidoreductases n=1 Tax=Lawsonia intracellularis (strain PHE/MN1-00) TaxID=363253 RepID=Q1MRJ5_LAWIP|nr:NAD(P)-dependent oxidoreductase [Lawsonia intracellularis]AGC49737.1 oxidoreductase [Lawsonia intracellularis N343]KAA0205243.1 dihydropyrimidine dehydrogenase [Lawsonia intracellularis]MBZ3892227.1 NAD(P)-dependent oxidoreductase [Lawsonia intracellularis]OMQ04852.1 dihydropyrimidine dehydrogenase [Lawsonia intracellularis]RBN32210.1 NAD(P)-dependent oxidoreductase [Lawsonia intracellularis]